MNRKLSHLTIFFLQEDALSYDGRISEHYSSSSEYEPLAHDKGLQNKYPLSDPPPGVGQIIDNFQVYKFKEDWHTFVDSRAWFDLVSADFKTIHWWNDTGHTRLCHDWIV
jgi:hypothetical protein